jgi:glycosyltransferase involved in cell wall biosynthesis
VLAALDRAAAIVPLNPKNAACLPHPEKHRDLPPFLDIEPAGRTDSANDPPVLIAAGMMRTGAKLASYRLLAEALARLEDRPWRLEIAGDGPARPEVEAAVAPLGPRAVLLGALAPEALRRRLAAADLYVWPAVEEAYGMATLEAMAAGLPVVAGDEGGVSALVADGETGLLASPRDPADFAARLARLLDDPGLRRRMGAAGADKVRRRHGLAAASRTLDAIVREAVKRPARR